jgi:hypothetical protein
VNTPFGTSLRRRPGDARPLWERIDAQVAERIEDALDAACLDLMVQVRRERGLPMPVATSAADRREFEELVGGLLDRLAVLKAELTPEQQRRMAPTRSGASRARAVTLQVALAKLLPDYWARFERLRIDFVNERRAGATSNPSH